MLKFLEEKDVDGKIVRQEVSISGKGKPVPVIWGRGAPAIAGAFALEVQTGFTAAGSRRNLIPSRPSLTFASLQHQRRPRTSFHLPKDRIRDHQRRPHDRASR